MKTCKNCDHSETIHDSLRNYHRRCKSFGCGCDDYEEAKMPELFDVWQFFADEGQERVRLRVPLEEAVSAAKHYSHNVAARIGVTQRVIIVDSGDLIVFEWVQGKGVIFPPKES